MSEISKARTEYEVYNLKFQPWCETITIFDYQFRRVADYRDQVSRLQHLGTVHGPELTTEANTGQHAITAVANLPDEEPNTTLEWADAGATALSDILLLLSLFSGRDIFSVDPDDDDPSVIIADPRVYQWGGILQTSIPYKGQVTTSTYKECNVGFEETLDKIYRLIRSDDWQQKYQCGYFLFLAKQAFKRQTLESTFIQCWTIWEHLFYILNCSWLSDEQIRRIHSSEKISFLLVEYALTDDIDDSSRERIKDLANIRNNLVHFGRLPEGDQVKNDAVLFIRLTEFVITKILSLSPSNVFNTMERLEEFIEDSSSS